MRPVSENAGYLESEEAFDFLYSDMAREFTLPIRLNPNRFHTTYSLLQVIRGHFPRTPGATLCEIGCAPGQWLIYFHEYFKYLVHGMDLSSAGIELTLANLNHCGAPAKILQADAFHFPFGDMLFDVVFSHSLIEHFKNPMAVFELHDLMTKPGGLIYIGMPNLRYANHAVFFLVDRFMGKFSELRETQNTGTANLGLFREAAGKFGWEIAFLDYIGFFIPLLYSPPRADPGKTTYHSIGRLVGRKMPTSRFFSPLICMIARKPL